MKRVLIGFVVVALAAFAAAYGWRWQLISELRKPILAELNDPDSAVFRSESVVGPWVPSEVIYCGEINARNRMGGYVGYVRFFSWPARDGVKEAVHEIESDKHSAEWIRKICDDLRHTESSWWWIRW